MEKLLQKQIKNSVKKDRIIHGIRKNKGTIAEAKDLNEGIKAKAWGKES